MCVQPRDPAPVTDGQFDFEHSGFAGQHVCDTLQQVIHAVTGERRNHHPVTLRIGELAKLMRAFLRNQIQLVPDLDDRDF